VRFADGAEAQLPDGRRRSGAERPLQPPRLCHHRSWRSARNHYPRPRCQITMKKLSTRAGFGLAAAVCAGLLAFAYYLQYVQHLEPCPLCYVQRWFFYAMLAVFVVAAIHGRGALVYGGLTTLFAAGGLAAASRQVWLQHLPADKVPQCGPDLIFMLKN